MTADIEFLRGPMAFGLSRKRPAEPRSRATEPEPLRVDTAAEVKAASDTDSARQVLGLLELELGGLIRQLERAAGSVAGGAEATAATLSTIRQRTDALSGRSSAAQSTATI